MNTPKHITRAVEYPSLAYDFAAAFANPEERALHEYVLTHYPRLRDDFLRQDRVREEFTEYVAERYRENKPRAELDAAYSQDRDEAAP